jgi:hypothetical protein
LASTGTAMRSRLGRSYELHSVAKLAPIVGPMRNDRFTGRCSHLGTSASPVKTATHVPHTSSFTLFSVNFSGSEDFTT